ncbi:hypothetical protein, partial [Chitinivorax sp. B]|uniref:hypothetical protein n=1 Tax=Chitinivorax sp. B TaxID=2502235 RepID=UPI001484FA9B
GQNLRANSQGGEWKGPKNFWDFGPDFETWERHNQQQTLAHWQNVSSNMAQRQQQTGNPLYAIPGILASALGNANAMERVALALSIRGGGKAGIVENSGLKRAEALRDAKLAEISMLSKTQQAKITTVVGAHDPATGRVAVGVKVTCGANAGRCAEDLASEALGNPKVIEFTKVIRPRNDKVIPRCERCVGKYGPEN